MPEFPTARQFVQSIMSLLGPARSMLPGLAVIIIVVQCLQFVAPYLFKEIIDTFVTFKGSAIPQLLKLIAGMFVVYLVLAGVMYFRNKRIFLFLLSLDRWLPIAAQRKLVSLSLGYHEQADTGNTIVKIQRGTDLFVHIMATFVFDFFPTAMQTIATFIFLMILNVRIGLVFVWIVPLFVWMTYRVNRKVQPLRKTRHKGYERAGGVMAQAMLNIGAVQSFCQEPREVDDLTNIREHIFSVEWQEWLTVLRSGCTRDVLINIGRASVLLFSVYEAYRGAITIGDLVLFLTLSEQAYLSLFRMSRLFDYSAEGAEAIRRLNALLEEQSEISNPNNGRQVTIAGGIVFDNVSFSYRDGREALHDVSFTVEPGTTVALVGPSGGGKTTIVKLLWRHYDPQHGRILVDGHDVRLVDLRSYRKQLAVVPQEVEIFNRTIEENIAYARPGVSHADVERAARLANAHDFIVTLPDSYATRVGERGIRLSGGQRQRIGIARAILADPRVFVFDEATSHLDTHSERLIQEALHRFRAGRTTFVIAHRLSTIRQADTIVVLEGGRLVEQGSHERLLHKNGLYAKLHHLQLDGVLDA